MTLEDKLSIYENKMNELKQENNDKESKIEKLKKEIDEDYMVKMDSLQSKLNDIKEENENNSNELTKVRDELNEKKMEILNLEHENAVLTDHTLKNLKEENEKLNGYLTSSESVNKDLTIQSRI